mmetsp:Transcript_23862/g.39440  ORF Transcript_23862/g.39440 Transcript_23862/m.39440 type:complete len:671 (-) Transcript_23862:81-2093(-)
MTTITARLAALNVVLFYLASSLRTSSCFAERVYDNLEFTATTCEELGPEYATDFDVCAVIEFCTSSDDDDNDDDRRNLVDHDAPLSQFQTEVAEAEMEQAHTEHEDHTNNHDDDDEEEAEETTPSESSSTTTTTTTSTTTTVPPPPPPQRPAASHNNNKKAAAASDTTKTTKTTSPPPNHAQYGWRIQGSTTCSYPGPIMRLMRGSNHGLFVRGADGNAVAVKTNLHFHGLHVAGASHANGDDLYRSVEGSANTMIYGLNMPADQHHGGTHWYHSHISHDHHSHGSSSTTTSSWEQVKGGAFGMIVVDDNGHDVGTDDPDVLDFLQRKQEKIMVLDNSHDMTWRANGLHDNDGGETYHLVQDEWYRLRILAVNVESHRDQETIAFDGTVCDVRALAHDGIFRFHVPKSKAQSEFLLSSSSRLDVAIRCSDHAEITIGRHAKTTVVATIQVDASKPPSSVTPFVSGTDTWKSARLEYTKDLRHLSLESTTNPWTVKIEETNINGINSGRKEPLCNDDGNDFAYGTVQEIELKGADTHPFHVHMYPMQVVSSSGSGSGSCGSGHDAGQFYDTIVTAGGGSGPCVLRLHFIDVAGPTTVHCHIFQHADQGALGYFNVVDGGGGGGDDPDQQPPPNDDADDGPSCMEGSTCEEGQPMLKCSDLDRQLLLRRRRR